MIIAQGERFCRYPDGEEIAPYVDGAGSCVVKYEGEELAGKMGISGRAAGTVYAFGVQIGAAYAAKNIPHVPYAQGNKEMYPFVQSKTTLVKDILGRHGEPAGGICERGIETAVYEDGMIIVNHRSTPFVLPQKYREEIYQYPWCRETKQKAEKGVLAGHEAVWVSV